MSLIGDLNGNVRCCQDEQIGLKRCASRDACSDLGAAGLLIDEFQFVILRLECVQDRLKATGSEGSRYGK